MRILKESTSALMIDIQEKLFPHMSQKEELLNKVQRLVAGIKALNIPLLVTEQYRKGLGETLPTIVEQIQEFRYTEKISFSCCDDEPTMNELSRLGKPNVLVFGIEAHVCVLQTVIDLKQKGFVPIVIEDCISSRTLNDKVIAIARMRQEGAMITTMESILFELCRYSGNDQFKSISKIVK